jgi:hypothetical protein
LLRHSRQRNIFGFSVSHLRHGTGKTPKHRNQRLERCPPPPSPFTPHHLLHPPPPPLKNMAKPKPGLEDEWEIINDRADTPTRERPPEEPNTDTVVEAMSGLSVSPAPQEEHFSGAVPVPLGAPTSTNEQSTAAPSSGTSSTEAERAPSPTKTKRKVLRPQNTEHPSNSVSKVRDAYRALARYSITGVVSYSTAVAALCLRRPHLFCNCWAHPQGITTLWTA